MLWWQASPSGSSGAPKRQLLASPAAAVGSDPCSQDSSERASVVGEQASTRRCRRAAGELPSFVRFPAARGGTLQWSHLLSRNFPFNWFLDASSLSRRIKTLVPSAPAFSLPAAARPPATPLPSRPPRSARRGAGIAARRPSASPKTTLPTAGALHPPGESGREKSRAAAMRKKVTLTNLHLPSFPLRMRGGPCIPHTGRRSPSGRGPTLPLPPSDGGCPLPQRGTGTVPPPSPAAQNLLLRSHLQACQGNPTPPRSPPPRSVTVTRGPRRASSPDAPHQNWAAVPGHHLSAPASRPR